MSFPFFSAVLIFPIDSINDLSIKCIERNCWFGFIHISLLFFRPHFVWGGITIVSLCLFEQQLKHSVHTWELLHAITTAIFTHHCPIQFSRVRENRTTNLNEFSFFVVKYFFSGFYWIRKFFFNYRNSFVDWFSNVPVKNW